MQRFNIFKNFYKKPLWVHFLWVCAIFIFLITLLYFSLGIFTYHNRYRIMPNVVGVSVEEAAKVLEDKDLRMQVRDSMFLTQYPKGTVVKQIPAAESEVKVHRNVYLIVNKKIPPDIEIPKVVGLNIGVATGVVKGAGFVLGETFYATDFAKNIVLGLRYKGKTLAEGDKVPMGERIDFVIGTGMAGNAMRSENMDEDKVWVPDLIGKTLQQAKQIAQDNRIALIVQNELDFGNKDLSGFFVIKQTPFRYDEENQVRKMLVNSPILVWLSEISPLQ